MTITITTAAKRAAIPAVLAAAILLSTAALSGMEEPRMDFNATTTTEQAVTTADAETAIVIHPQVLPEGLYKTFTGDYADADGYVWVRRYLPIRNADGSIREIREYLVPTNERLPF